MNILLRSCIPTKPSEDSELCAQNVRILHESELDFGQTSDGAIFTFIKDFVDIHQHAPSSKTLEEHFLSSNDTASIDRLRVLETYTPLYRGDFEVRLKAKAEERRTKLSLDLLEEAKKIITQGIKVKEGRKEKLLHGAEDAIHYLMNRSHDLVAPVLGTKLSGEVTMDGQDFYDKYMKTKSDPLAGLGQMTGIQQMDATLRGAKKKQLWTHAAFTGGLKSTFMLNWAYNQAVYYGHDSVIFSLEMPYEQDRDILFAMHSTNASLEPQRKKYNIKTGLDYQKIRDGELMPNEEDYLREVVADFSSGKYGKIHVEVAPPTVENYTVADIRARAELIHSSSPLSLLFVDHAGLMSPRHYSNSTTERLNEVLRDFKKMSMGFNKGEGIAVVCLFQISREGFKSAEKNGGNYNLTHLSYANEAERSSDIVTTSYVDDDLKKQNFVRFQCLKSRDNPPFEPFHSSVYWPTRRVQTCTQQPLTDAEKQSLGDQIDTEEIDLNDI